MGPVYRHLVPSTDRPGRRIGRCSAVLALLSLLCGLLVTDSLVIPSAVGAAALIVVTTEVDVVADDGDCSLREAIEAADTETASGVQTGECVAGSGDDIITFTNSGMNIQLALGELTINSNMTIMGGGATIDGGGSHRVLTIDTATTAIRDLTLRDGDTTGNGGGVQLLGTGLTTFTSVTITNNTAAGTGGGIWTETNLTLVDSTVTMNVDAGDTGGGGIRHIGGDLAMTDTTVSHNIAAGVSSGAGGIKSYDPFGAVLVVDVVDSVISHNTALGGGGTGGLSGRDVLLQRTTVDSNVGVITGGVGATAAIQLLASTVSNNTGNLSVSLAPDSLLFNTTISGNSGRVQVASTDVATILYTTITGSSTEGLRLLGNGSLTLGASVIAGNSDTDVSAVSGYLGSFTAGAFNIVGSVSDETPGGLVQFGPTDLVEADPLLAPLTDNGGSTMTHAPFVGSPVIDHVSGPPLNVAGIDQRGEPRPLGSNNDAGALEHDGIIACDGLTITVDIGAGDSPTSGNDVILGTSGPDIISGGDGNDTICGGAGDDIINGGNGIDVIFGEGDDDTINGQGQGDTLDGGAGNDTITGGTGNDTINGGPDDDTINGQGSPDIINGENGVDDLTGGSGNDTIDPGPGATVGTTSDINAGEGADTINGGPDADDIKGGNGNDDIFGNGGDDVINGQQGIDDIYGGDGNDTLSGGSGADNLFGEANNDHLDGGSSTDVCDGGTEIDTASAACENNTKCPLAPHEPRAMLSPRCWRPPASPVTLTSRGGPGSVDTTLRRADSRLRSWSHELPGAPQ